MSRSDTSSPPLSPAPTATSALSPASFRRLQSRPTAETSAYGLVGHAHGPPILLVSLDEGGSSNYANGGLVEEREGDLGVPEVDEEARRRRRKGKGRMSDATRATEQPHDVGDEFPPATGDDDERESKRVADNLAQWARVEKQRRQTLRKSSTLVLPNAPISAATLSDLSRRSSAIFRTPSSRRATSMSRSIDPSLSPTLSSGEGRRSVRKSSMRLPERGESGSSARNPTLAGLSEEEDDSEEMLPVVGTHPESMSSPPPPEHPAIRSSRFIEHLPAQISPTSPAKSRQRYSSSITSSSSTSTILAESPTTTAAGDRTSLSLLQNPFSDVLATVPFSSRPVMQKRPSDSSIQTLASGTTDRVRSSKPSIESTRGLVSDQPRRIPSEWAAEDDEERSDLDEEEQDDVGGIGLLDWLLCGCWRNIGDGDEGDREQRGRTNPNE